LPASGWFNGALQLDGVDDYVDCGNDDRLNITDEITLAVWVKTNDSGNGEYNPYVSKGNHSYAIKHQYGNNIEFVIYDDWWYYVWYPVDSSFNDDWHHLAGTYDGSQLKLYVDGELEANSPYAGSIAGSTFNVNIGRNAEVTDRLYEGLIDDVVIFSRALNPEVIEYLRVHGGASFISDPNLSALWELDESSGAIAYDSSDNGIDGSLEPSSPLWQPAGGQLDGALEFDGFNDCVFIPNESRFDITDQVTVSAWIKVNAFERDWQSIVTKGDSAWRLHRLRDTNSIAFNCNLYPNSWGAKGSINVNNGQWHHVAGVYDETQAYLYVDGVLDNSEAAVGLIGTNDYPVMIGENAEQPGRFWNGLIDDVRIYTCALGPSEVYLLYSNICYVDADATGNNNGSSWTDAFNYLQDALAAQATSLCEIHVAEGTYKPDANSSNPSGTGDRAATFQLINGVSLKGGYAGFGQPDPNARDCDLYETTLSGDINTPGDDTDNCYHVVTSSGCDLNTVLEGFTITGGNAYGTNPEDRGAGMYNNNSSPAVTNCRFSGNIAAYGGGGMGNESNSNPIVTNCTFSGNIALYGGGGMGNVSSSPIVTNCTFSGNTVSNSGGGIGNVSSSPTITNCTFSGNSANFYGGGMFNDNSSPIVTNCTFSGNTATYDGGGMYNANSSPTVTNCILWGDTPDEIFDNSSTTTVTYSDVQGGWGGTGNIDANPLFDDADLRLSVGSPCIDAGDNSVITEGADLDGHPRIIDGDCNDTDIVDMGAYEFNYAYLGDFDYNCKVNFGDFAILGLAWLTEPPDENWNQFCDISIPANNKIDWADVKVLSDNWLAGL
jgi:parallel beta-helix repeat protein